MTLEQRVTANEKTINQLMSLQESTLELIREVKQAQVEHQKSMVEMRREMVDMRGEYTALITEMRRDHQEQMAEMRRFNAGTRKLWLAIARKVEWLDEDDWPED